MESEETSIKIEKSTSGRGWMWFILNDKSWIIEHGHASSEFRARTEADRALREFYNQPLA
jgi:hypothetical protein